MSGSQHPILLLTVATEQHPFDDYLAEVLLTEGYTGFEHGRSWERRHPAGVVIVDPGAASQIPLEDVRAYFNAGGKLIVIQPPPAWAPLLGLAEVGELYRVTVDPYMQVNTEHSWLHDWPDRDLQCPGESHVYRAEGAECLAYIAGQLGAPSIFPAIARHRVGAGEVVTFAYDLAATLVLFQQGRPENSSTGRNPDANRDGKFCADDAMEGMRDYRLRFIPQADLHRDLLVRVIRGLLADRLPLPRLWHFPNAAPALLFLDGDGDSMTWDDLVATVARADEHAYPYTLYMMRPEIEAFEREAVLALRQRGHEFGVHPWCGPRPTVEEWDREIVKIVALFRERFGFQPTSLRAHSCIFPGWDENPSILRQHGLRLDTSVCPGYRYRDGFPNGSGLPLRFVDRQGRIVDCWEQSTIQTEDGALTPKVLLPTLTREEAQALAEQMMERITRVYHGVFHPYFHPINLGTRGAQVGEWFSGVMRKARELGLEGVNASEWLAFNDARIEVRFAQVQWQGEVLSFLLTSPHALRGATVLLPPCGAMRPVTAMVDGAAQELQEVDLERLGWAALVLDVEGGASVAVQIRYEERQ